MSLTVVREIEKGAAALFVICQCFYSYTLKKRVTFTVGFLAGCFQVIAKAIKLVQFTQLIFNDLKHLAVNGSIENRGALYQTGSENLRY